ncbi:MAG: hypothetical protein AB1521_00720 [Bacteroidota bacterium]
MSLLRLILWGLLFFLAWRTIKNIINAVSGVAVKSEKKKEHIRRRENQSKIKQEDIVDADFVEIIENKSEKSKN